MNVNHYVNIYLGKIGKKFHIHLYLSIPGDVFKQNRFAPLKNNIRSNWYEGLDTAAIEEIGKQLHSFNAAGLVEIFRKELVLEDFSFTGRFLAYLS